ncbi:hypothetical protein CY34DRAFT_723041 [Suillus luteus UH-Slu-Lm8-n1]|uniref:Uncharacterized protein n=1 Tax=Suillus luteus UH-Slu-Lm8-n1 TaxID=930992 RepID=A0A0C9ZUY7_9AGAM|nr:hypothetical protein CY34DRAFT_723041 [Suillus luteus UH-Slu-Lm8-n1]
MLINIFLDVNMRWHEPPQSRYQFTCTWRIDKLELSWLTHWSFDAPTHHASRLVPDGIKLQLAMMNIIALKYDCENDVTAPTLSVLSKRSENTNLFILNVESLDVDNNKRSACQRYRRTL